MAFAEQLKSARLSSGMTQQQVADAMGITNSTYCGYETGKRQPDVEKIKQLAKILNTSGDILLETGYVGSNFENSLLHSLTSEECEHIKKYRTLDEYGKAAVDSILNIEHKRCAEQVDSPRPMVMAAARSGAVSQIEEIHLDELPDNTPLP
nr:helix-turn-helix transcriptional regulator [uncultured Agathobaculum sp.]